MHQLNQKVNSLIWIFQGAREGDNAQARALAMSVGELIIIKSLDWTALRFLPNSLLGSSLANLTREAAASLHPPWPDLVIAVGRRTVPAALWVKEQSSRTVLVHLGRPRAPSRKFDLVVTTPQYGLVPGTNVRQVLLPIAEAAEAPVLDSHWEQDFAPLPRPWVGILVGGTRFPSRFDPAAAQTLASTANARVRKLGGSALYSTSPRTGSKQAAILADALDVPGYVHRWQRGADNPHRVILEQADRFIVTDDSISMIGEACRTRRPVEVFEVPRSPLGLTWRAQKGVSGWLNGQGLLSPPRNTLRVREILVERGHVKFLGQEDDRDWLPYRDEWPAIVTEIRALVSTARLGAYLPK